MRCICECKLDDFIRLAKWFESAIISIHDDTSVIWLQGIFEENNQYFSVFLKENAPKIVTYTCEIPQQISYPYIQR